MDKKDLKYMLVIAILVAVAYGNTIFNDFLHYDDVVGIVENSKLLDLKGALIKMNIKNVSYGLLISIFGLNKVVLHLNSLLIHFLNAILVYKIFSQIFEKNKGVITALLFAVHPATSEAVNWLSGSVYLYSAFFNLLTIYLFVLFRKSNKKLYLAFSILTYVAYFIMMRTPWMLVTPLILIVTDVFLIKGRKNIVDLFLIKKEHLPFIVTAIAYVAVNLVADTSRRIEILGQETLGTENISYFYKTGRNLFKVITLYIVPIKLSLVSDLFKKTFTDFVKIIFGYASAIWLLIISYKNDKKIFALMLLIITSILPLLAPFKISVNLAERYFYLGTVFYSAILASVLYNWKEKYLAKKSSFISLLVVIIMLFTFRTFLRTFDWRNDKAIWMSAKNTTPNHYKIYSELGNVYFREDDLREALTYYEKAIEIRPVYPIVHHNIGLIFLKAGQLDNAEEYFKKSLTQDPNLIESEKMLLKINEIKESPPTR